LGRGSSSADRGRAGHRQVRAGAGGGGGVPAVGWQVFWGSGDELGQALPLLPFFDGLGCASPGGKPDSNRLRLADGAAGNPLYVTELLAALDRRSSLTITDAGTAELASGSAPSSLSAAIADRLGFVAGPTREVLKAAALLGMEFAVPDLAVVLSRSVADLITAVDEACAAGVLAEFGGGLGFRHPLIRAALYDETPAPLRAAWHRDVGRALAEAGALTNTAIIADAGPHATQHVKCRCSIKRQGKRAVQQGSTTTPRRPSWSLLRAGKVSVHGVHEGDPATGGPLDGLTTAWTGTRRPDWPAVRRRRTRTLVTVLRSPTAEEDFAS